MLLQRHNLQILPAEIEQNIKSAITDVSYIPRKAFETLRFNNRSDINFFVSAFATRYKNETKRTKQC